MTSYGLRTKQYTVTAVKKEWDSGHTHRHIAGVWAGGTYYTRQQVVNSIKAGDTWRTSHNGRSAVIEPVDYCHRLGCFATPYIRTRRDNTTTDNLENLPEKNY